MRPTAVLLIGLLATAFALVNGVLMFVSPKRYAAFLRWYTRSQVSGIESGPQIELRIAGLVIAGMSVFFGWILIEKVGSGRLGFVTLREPTSPMTGSGSWFGLVAGGLAIFTGVYSLLRPRSVGSWFQAHGTPHPPETATFLRRIKTLGILFIVVGAFFIFVAIRNP
jgi:hypothetical protein